MNAGAPGSSATDAQRRVIVFIALATMLLLGVGGVIVARWIERAGASDAPMPEYRIDLNTADAAALQLLPGIGPSVAARIVEERDRRGPFRDLDDLQLRVKGIGLKIADRMRPYVVFSNPPSPKSASARGQGGAAN